MVVGCHFRHLVPAACLLIGFGVAAPRGLPQTVGFSDSSQVVPPQSQSAAVQPASFPQDQVPAASPAGLGPNPLAAVQNLPASAGQVLQQYDLRPYTHQISTTQSPQKAVIDWILRETGTEIWFNEPFGVLHATRDQLIVYHTPEVQAVVKNIVDRFVLSGGRQQMLGLKLVAVGNPNWRSSAAAMMQPIEMRTAGVEGWMISRENAAILLNQLRRRADYSEHGGGDLTAHEGQRTVVTRTRPIDFVHALRWVPGQVPAYQSLAKRIDEGYNLEISFLTGQENTIDAVLRCDVDQVEKLQTVAVDVPDYSGRNQAVQVQVPQMVSWRLQERFRWPADQVLLISCGVVANPTEAQTNGFNLQSLLNGSRRRSDALLFIEYKGPQKQNLAPRQAANPGLVPVTPPAR